MLCLLIKLKMTQQELITLVLDLKCCSARLSSIAAINIINGKKTCDLTKLMLLNDYIDLLLKYDIDGVNCLIEEEFEQIVDNSKQICVFCDCEE